MKISFVKTVERMIEILGHGVAYLGLFMALITVVIVILRYGFDVGSIALQESVLYMHGTLFMIGLAYAMQSDGHVRVDIIYSRLSASRQRWINVLGHLLFLIPLAIIMIVYSWDYVVASWRVQESSPDVGGMPGIFLLKSLIPLSACLIILQALCQLTKLLVDMRQEHG